MSQPSAVRDAVIRGHKIELMRALDRDSKLVNEEDCDGVTLLMDAAANNHINILTMLLEHKAAINPTNRLGRSALMEAACRGHPAITLRLCQSRPDLNYANPRHPLELTSLMEASSRGHAGVAFWLCEAKADINATNKSGDSALILAAHNNRLEAVKVLIAQGANAELRGDNGRTALEVAVERGHTRIAHLLTKYKGQGKEALQVLCQELKAKQKAVLQDEVNYDASVLSRKIKPLDPLPLLPAFREEFVGIAIPYNRGVNSTEYAELQRQFKLTHPTTTTTTTTTPTHSSSSSSLISSSVSPKSSSPTLPTCTMAPFGLTLQDYPTPPFKYDPIRHLPRTKPFKLLPKFGSCSWVALSTRRVHGSNPSRTRAQRIAEHQQAMETNDSPTLTIFDNGYWTYKNDQVSGNLEGTFTVHHSITHGTISHVTNVPFDPLRLINNEYEWVSVDDPGAAEHDEEVIEQDGVTYKRLEIESFSPEYDWQTYPNAYLIQLRTGGEADGESKVNTPLQIVDCYLGKQVVLGQLIMEMLDNDTPWWKYVDEQEERVEWHQYEIDLAANEQCENHPGSTGDDNPQSPRSRSRGD